MNVNSQSCAGRAHPTRIRWIGVAIASMTLSALLASVPPASAAEPMIVEASPGSVARAARIVEAAGGTIERDLPIVNGFVASVPADRIDALRAHREIATITPDRRIELLDDDSFDDEGRSMFDTARQIRADELWRRGITGKGIDVALIDSGVAPVQGLRSNDKVLNGPDLSFDQNEENLRYLDLYGHGTHMAGIIAGDPMRKGEFVGIAPQARIINVKVANAMGATDVSQVIAAIDWVVQHRNDPGVNIRVLNLSFGTDSIQDVRTDPLAHAVQVAWRKGIVVVTAAGNRGAHGLTQPARDPWVLAIGAIDTDGTSSRNDDSIPVWSSRGDGARNPDVVAPGVALTSLRVPNSYLDVSFPAARSDEHLFRGSGTSQAAAVTSGAAALLLQQRPSLTPDQVKALLAQTATRVRNANRTEQGHGFIDLRGAATSQTPAAVQSHATSTGTGSLEGSRGSYHVVDGEGTPLVGEIDIFGNEWTGEAWALAIQAGTSWSGGEWMGTSWSGACWCGTSWSGTSWSGTSWSSLSWAGTSWSGTSWSDASWSGTSWSSIEFPAAGTSWSGTSWSGTSWSGTSWSGTSWSTMEWH